MIEEKLLQYIRLERVDGSVVRHMLSTVYYDPTERRADYTLRGLLPDQLATLRQTPGEWVVVSEGYTLAIDTVITRNFIEGSALAVCFDVPPDAFTVAGRPEAEQGKHRFCAATDPPPPAYDPLTGLSSASPAIDAYNGFGASN